LLAYVTVLLQPCYSCVTGSALRERGCGVIGLGGAALLISGEQGIAGDLKEKVYTCKMLCR